MPKNARATTLHGPASRHLNDDSRTLVLLRSSPVHRLPPIRAGREKSRIVRDRNVDAFRNETTRRV